jgi:hypothetical protein
MINYPNPERKCTCGHTAEVHIQTQDGPQCTVCPCPKFTATTEEVPAVNRIPRDTQLMPAPFDIKLRQAIRGTLAQFGADPLNPKQLECIEQFVKVNIPKRENRGTFPLTLHFRLETERDELIQAIRDQYPDMLMEA